MLTHPIPEMNRRLKGVLLIIISLKLIISMLVTYKFFRMDMQAEIEDIIRRSQNVVKPKPFNPLVIPKKKGLLEKISLKKVLEFKPEPKPFKFK